MLQKFNNLYKKFILEQIENDNDSYIAKYNTDEFFKLYIFPASEKNSVIATKQMVNTFLMHGSIKNVIKFFSDFKVDKEFMKNPAEFLIYSPMFIINKQYDSLNLDQYFPMDNFEATGVPTMNELSNISRSVIRGHWMSFNEDDEYSGRFVKAIKPSDLSAKIKALSKDLDEDELIFVEFKVDVDGRSNQIWDKESEYFKETEIKEDK